MGIRYRGRFLGNLRLYVRGGYGGPGSPKFGGLGGDGGSIYIEQRPDCSLRDLMAKNPDKRYIARSGFSSQQFMLVGKAGADIVLPAPPGTVCVTDDGITLGEVNKNGDKVLVARGGAGGSPTNGFMGQKGEHTHVKLILKLIADIGLVGFPNAGKSTLLRGVSRARPKVASYPFTTLEPNLGIMQYHDERQISMADLPGLIEGAWANRGLGHSFLQHVERTKLLMLVVDVNGFRLHPKHKHRTAMESLLLLNKELELYDPTLLSKPAMLIINKMDTPGSSDLYAKLIEELGRGREGLESAPEQMRPSQLLKLSEVIGICAKTNVDSVQFVKERVRLLLDVLDEQNALPPSDETALEVVDEDTHFFKERLVEHGTRFL